MEIPKDLESLKFKVPSLESSFGLIARESQRKSEKLMDEISKSSQEKLAREKKLVEETENTRQLIEEFKSVVQEFIVASEAQTKATEDNNKIVKDWTTRIGWLTLAMSLFAAATLYFTYLTYIN